MRKPVMPHPDKVLQAWETSLHDRQPSAEEMAAASGVIATHFATVWASAHECARPEDLEWLKYADPVAIPLVVCNASIDPANSVAFYAIAYTRHQKGQGLTAYRATVMFSPTTLLQTLEEAGAPLAWTAAQVRDITVAFRDAAIAGYREADAQPGENSWCAALILAGEPTAALSRLVD